MESVKISKNDVNVTSGTTTEITSKELADKVSADPSYIEQMVGHRIGDLLPEHVDIDPDGRVIITNKDFAAQAEAFLQNTPVADEINFGIVCGGNHHFMC